MDMDQPAWGLSQSKRSACMPRERNAAANNGKLVSAATVRTTIVAFAMPQA